MSEHSRRIRQNYDWLTDNLDSESGLLAILYAKEVLSRREYAQIVPEKDQFAKTEMLLTIISRKSVQDFTEFVSALKETSQGHIASRLAEVQFGMSYNLICSFKHLYYPISNKCTSRPILCPEKYHVVLTVSYKTGKVISH